MKHLFLLLVPVLFVKCKKDDISQPVAPAKYKTVIIGSSIASGVGASDYSYSWAGLVAKNNSDDTFINYSVPGYTTFQFLPTSFTNTPIRPDTSVNISAVLRQKPNIVLISITTNDIANGFTPTVYMRNMKVITDSLQANNIKFLVTSSTLRDDLSGPQNDSLFVIAHRLKEQYSKNCVEIMSVIADTVTLKPLPGLYISDRIHPNNTGHALLYSRINAAYQAIR